MSVLKIVACVVLAVFLCHSSPPRYPVVPPPAPIVPPAPRGGNDHQPGIADRYAGLFD
jgi:hypothetical protein